jgi:hypothetical protein
MLVVLVHYISLMHYCTILFLHSQNCVSSHWVMNTWTMNTLCRICAQCQTHSTAASFRLVLFRLVATVFICNHSTMIPYLCERTRCFVLLEEPRRVRSSGTYIDIWPALPPTQSLWQYLFRLTLLGIMGIVLAWKFWFLVVYSQFRMQFQEQNNSCEVFTWLLQNGAQLDVLIMLIRRSLEILPYKHNVCLFRN